jgi:hypothetical protein
MRSLLARISIVALAGCGPAAADVYYPGGQTPNHAAVGSLGSTASPGGAPGSTASPSGPRADAVRQQSLPLSQENLQGNWRCVWSHDQSEEDLVVTGQRFKRRYALGDDTCEVQGSIRVANGMVAMQEQAWKPEGCTPPPEGQGVTHHKALRVEPDVLTLSSNVESGGNLSFTCSRAGRH